MKGTSHSRAAVAELEHNLRELSQFKFVHVDKIKNGEAKIIIGARSAIFAPVENLGIIIIDEEHDSSYKAEGVPRYDAKEVARKIAKKNNIPLVLGSATPDFTSYFRAKNEKITLLKLTKRANEASLPDIEVVDLREELAKRK